MFKTFPNIRMAVLVGIWRRIPYPNVYKDPLDGIHLGDVVVGWPGDGKPACVYHNRGRSKVDWQFEVVGTMQDPDWRLTNALGILTSNYELSQTTIVISLRGCRVIRSLLIPDSHTMGSLVSSPENTDLTV
jgi:hypothetical protein